MSDFGEFEYNEPISGFSHGSGLRSQGIKMRRIVRRLRAIFFEKLTQFGGFEIQIFFSAGLFVGID